MTTACSKRYKRPLPRNAQKHCINAYIECPYLAGCNRRYLPQVEYANDSIDLILLVFKLILSTPPADQDLPSKHINTSHFGIKPNS